MNLPRISDALTTQQLLLLHLAHANGNLTEAEKRRRVELLAWLRREPGR